MLNHNGYENLDFLGHSSRRIPISVNRDFMTCDVRIALGMITPRDNMFGGGSKLLLPGACRHVSITANHHYVREGFLEHLDEVARMAGLNFIVNPLLSPELEIIGLVTGDPEAAFWKGVGYGKDVYKTPIPENVGVGVFNAFPKDTELVQAGLAMVPLNSTKKNLLKENATVTAACPEGLGWHSVLGPGTALAGKPRPPALEHHRLLPRRESVGRAGKIRRRRPFLQDLAGSDGGTPAHPRGQLPRRGLPRGAMQYGGD